MSVAAALRPILPDMMDTGNPAAPAPAALAAGASAEPAKPDGCDSLPTSRLARAATIGRAGLKIGGNFARYHARRVLAGVDDREALHRANARDSFASFAELRGGPLKAAQMLSLDRNILPPAFQEQFARAHYSTPPLSWPLVAHTLRREYGRPVEEVFDSIARTAAAAASIGQVHRATRGGRPLAVKVQYPGVRDSLRSDLRMLKPLALRLFGLEGQDVDRYFAEVEERLAEETDYRLEAARGTRLGAATAHLAGVRFPRYCPDR